MKNFKLLALLMAVGCTFAFANAANAEVGYIDYHSNNLFFQRGQGEGAQYGISF